MSTLTPALSLREREKGGPALFLREREKGGPALSLREREKGGPALFLRERGRAELCTFGPLSRGERVRVRGKAISAL
ncbi:hypothetical protein [Enterobacter sp.]|uniref:hypothetical protein n=1 Tax=Enterobacter sp. TaxID=42895 RepID=UPI00296E8C41|nr:hypothetical protein [Enterobacter sp.]